MKNKFFLLLILLLSSCGNQVSNEPTVEPTTGQTEIPTEEPSIDQSSDNVDTTTFANGGYEFIINSNDNTFIINFENNLISEGTYKKLSNRNCYYCTSNKTSYYVYANSNNLDIPYLMDYDSTLSNNSYDIDYCFYEASYPAISYYSYITLFDNGVYRYVSQYSPLDNTLREEVYGTYELRDNFIFTEEKTYVKSGNVLWDLQCDEGKSYRDAHLLSQSRKTYHYFEEKFTLRIYDKYGPGNDQCINIDGYIVYFYKAYSIIYNVDNYPILKKDRLVIQLSNGFILEYASDQYNIENNKIILPNCNLEIDSSFLN